MKESLPQDFGQNNELEPYTPLDLQLV